MDDAANAAPDVQAPPAGSGAPQAPELLAAIDLGWNSFHLIVGRFVDGHLDVVGRLREAQRVLGHSIEVIAGREEARLIYLGIAHALAEDGERRLVVDIGGGSTECIVGSGFTPVHRESLYMAASASAGDSSPRAGSTSIR